MTFITITPPQHSDNYRVFINTEKIVEMTWNERTQVTYISYGYDDELREAKETPEIILRQIDSINAQAKLDTKPHRLYWAED